MLLLYHAFPPASIYPPRNRSHAAQPHTPNHHSSHSLHSVFAFTLSLTLFGMGNFVSCTMAMIPGAAKDVRIVLPDGGLRRVRPPATAAELMLEAPGHFLADARALQAGRRIVSSCANSSGLAVAVVNANAVISGGAALASTAGRLVTVLEEVCDAAARRRLALLPTPVETVDLTPAFVKRGRLFT